MALSLSFLLIHRLEHLEKRSDFHRVVGQEGIEQQSNSTGVSNYRPLRGKWKREMIKSWLVGTSCIKNHGMSTRSSCYSYQHLSRISMLCVWWGYQLGVVYYGLLKPSETITRSMIMLDLTRWAKVVKKYLESSKWQISPHPLSHSPDVAPSADFHLTHLAQWHTAWLTSTSARMKKWRTIGSTHGSYRKMRNIFADGFACCPRDGPKW
nr:transposase [Hymenolepis microstoma]